MNLLTKCYWCLLVACKIYICCIGRRIASAT